MSEEISAFALVLFVLGGGSSIKGGWLKKVRGLKFPAV